VELDHPAASPDGRPTQRVWAVRLRRGELVVEIADGLGWPSAAALARAIEHLLAPPRASGQAER
jgi:predicted methyltransferase